MNKESFDIKKVVENFIFDFVRKDKQERILQFLKKEKNWDKVVLEFHTSNVFKSNVLRNIKPNEQYDELICKKMLELGAKKNCCSLLDHLQGDEYEINLSEKLNDCVGFLVETIIYCPESGIGYFEGGHAKDRYILKK